MLSACGDHEVFSSADTGRRRRDDRFHARSSTLDQRAKGFIGDGHRKYKALDITPRRSPMASRDGHLLAMNGRSTNNW